jgi:hypothetical protein
VVGDYSWENAFTDGAGLVAGATGVALVLAGLGGRRGDWVDPEQGKGQRAKVRGQRAKGKG